MSSSKTFQIVEEYSEGSCGYLALFLAIKFDCKIISLKIYNCDAHFCVKYQNRYFDIFGWADSIEDVISRYGSFISAAVEVDKAYLQSQLKYYNALLGMVEQDWATYISDLWFDNINKGAV